MNTQMGSPKFEGGRRNRRVPWRTLLSVLALSGFWAMAGAHDPGAIPGEDEPVASDSVSSAGPVAGTSASGSDPVRSKLDSVGPAPTTGVLASGASDSSSTPGPGTSGIRDAKRGADVVVVGVRPMTAFSRAVFTDQDLSVRTQGGDPADVIKVTPGLFTGQHAGGGKANQYFIRGFDCDHGTDLAVWFDGMPVNEPSHAHGQGFADLHFIIPELVDRVQVDKGPYDIQYGDFATAAAVSMTTRSQLDENQVYLYGGAFGTYRAVSMLSLPESPRSILATEYYHSDGPFRDPEDHDRYNIFFKDSWAPSPTSTLALTLMGYGASWNASGQIPLRAVDSGWIPLYGSEDPSEGGNSQRFSAALNYLLRPDPHNTLRATAYLIDYRFSLFSDFTFYDVDTVNGDEINQRDDRTTAGFHADDRHEYEIGGVPTATTFGLEGRDDEVHTDLDHAVRRRIIGRFVDANVGETSLSEYAMQSIQPFPWLYAEAGLRGDHFGFDVMDNLHREGDSSLTGTRDAQIWSPKANVVFTPWTKTDIFLNYGRGFHSNDARGATSPVDPATPLTKAVGYEIGARTRLWNRLDLAASLWRLDLRSEWVWDGDEGATEFNGPTRREGVDASVRWRILDWLWTDLDVTRNTSVYSSDPGNSNAIALAPRFTAAGGLSWRHPSGFYGSLRFQHLDTRPADASDSLQAQGFTVLDLATGYRWKRWEILFNVGNLTDTRWYTAQFETTSRIKNPQGVLGPETTDMDVVPGPPINLKVGLKYYF